MTLFTKKDHFQKVFLHLDGDSFFAACEVALNPSLKGKPVITGLEKGIASAMTYEAKKRGVTRGMRLFEIRKMCPDAIILPSDYETYSIFSQRMYNIVRRYASLVEEYSIDECFADITNVVQRIYKKGGGLEEVKLFAQGIKDDLWNELGITFSLGIGPTKVLAKMGSKQQKPNGLTIITNDTLSEYRKQMPVDKIWGVGPSTSVTMRKLGIFTAEDFVQCNQAWVEDKLSKPYVLLWNELKGIPVHSINTGESHVYKSLSRTRMFDAPTKDKALIFAELSKNIEIACNRARNNNLVASSVSYYIKTQDFRYHSLEVRLSQPVNTPQMIIQAVKRTFDGVYCEGILYRSSGVTLHQLEKEGRGQQDLFGEARHIDIMLELYRTVDHIRSVYGSDTIFLASSLNAYEEQGEPRARTVGHLLAKGRKQLCIPLMGSVY